MSEETKQPVSDRKAPLYQSFGGANGNQSLASHTLDESGGDSFVSHGMAFAASTNVTPREGYNRTDWSRQRPEDGAPTKIKDIVKVCQDLYKRVGVVRNVIDLMSDFASDGIDLVHPVVAQETFYREWAKRVNLSNRAQMFMKCLLRDGNVIVRRRVGKLTLPVVKQWSQGVKVEKIKKDAKEPTRQIPWGYNFISPAIVDKKTGDIDSLTGETKLVVNLPATFITTLQASTNISSEVMMKLPKDIMDGVRAGNKPVLDPAITYVGYYKKDDWEEWATPFLYSVMDDISFKERLRQADLAALDGVINVIRLWKLGKSDQQILPTRTAVNKLIGILQNNVGGGCMDIVWDDMIDMEAYYPPIDKILGSDKYQAVNADILRGLGMPDALIGSSESTGNAQTMYVQLKTLVERLEYIRMECLIWLNNELKTLCKAMGFKVPPTVVFGNMSLRDENVEKQLIIQLLDRGVISVEAVHKAFGQVYVVELERIRRESQFRKSNPPLLERAGPYYRPESQLKIQFDQQMLLQRQKESGGDNPAGDQNRKIENAPRPGRPKNTKDVAPRNRNPKLLGSVAAQCVVAENFCDEIDGFVDKRFFAKHDVTTSRNLTRAQRQELESIKWMLLCHLEPDSVVTAETIQSILESPTTKRAIERDQNYRDGLSSFAQAMSRGCNLNERRRMMCLVWAESVSEIEEDHE